MLFLRTEKENIFTMSDKQLYFHLGMSRTGSTYLQKIVFPELQNITYFPKKNYLRYSKIIEDTNFDKYLFSYELDKDLEWHVDDLAKLYPNAKVILVFRRHDFWLDSRYKYYIRKHGYMSFDEFYSNSKSSSVWKPDDLLYRKKIEYVEKAFGSEPLVLLYNDLYTDAKQFISYIEHFTDAEIDSGVNINKVVKAQKFSDKQLKLLRWFNGVYKYKASSSPYKTVRLIHYKYREFLLHTLAFLFRFIPKGIVSKKPLITPSELTDVKANYDEDWNFCKNYSSYYKNTL